MTSPTETQLKNLSDAIRNRDLEFVVQFFAEYPKKINSFICGKEKHATALLFAVQNGAKPVALWLLEHGADATKRIKFGRRSTCLDFVFSISFDEEVARALLTSGANPCTANASRQPPLLRAIKFCANRSTCEIGKSMLNTIVTFSSPSILPQNKSLRSKMDCEAINPQWAMEVFDEEG